MERSEADAPVDADGDADMTAPAGIDDAEPSVPGGGSSLPTASVASLLRAVGVEAGVRFKSECVEAIGKAAVIFLHALAHTCVPMHKTVSWHAP